MPNHRAEKEYQTDPFLFIEEDIKSLMCNQLRTFKENKVYVEKEVITEKMLVLVLEAMDHFGSLLKKSKVKWNTNKECLDLISEFEGIYKEMKKAHKKGAILAIKPKKGEQLNPEIHNVVKIIKSVDKENNNIESVKNKGYTWQGKVIKKANVIVKKRGE